ncbi:hypothetical protein F4777DRAFT_381243 [Nemania sp. FL0916]|nr:hypothetical protein F4777DRAFT_381243 [Nemania sp. FL0916]
MPAEPTNWPKDQRKCQRPTDIVNTNAPQKDTAKFFPFEVQNFYKQFGGEQWRPGFPIIEDKGWVPNADQAKACVSFYNQQGATEPRFLTNNVAAECDWIPTSRGFLVDHPRGPLNGLGWGDFDNFTEWQDQGRKVTLDMLEKKVWRTGCKELLIFVPAPGEPPREPFVVDVQFDHSDQTDPDAPGDPGKSLFELLENKKERNKTRDELYRRGRGGRGGRGGHGGRG